MNRKLKLTVNKRIYATKIVFVFVLSLLIFTLYSFVSFEIDIYGFKIKKAEIKAFLTENSLNLPVENSKAQSDTIKKDSVTVKPKVRVVDSSNQVILFIGDSMVESLMHRLYDYTLENGHTLYPVIWFSSSTKAYGQSDKLRTYIKKYNPTYIIIALSSNELFVRDLAERDKYIKTILRQIDTNKFVWIGPPNWKEDTGINDLIMKNVGKERFFLSKYLKFERASDGAHPNLKSANKWCDIICEWIEKESKYPILLKYPQQKAAHSPNAVRMVYE